MAASGLKLQNKCRLASRHVAKSFPNMCRGVDVKVGIDSTYHLKQYMVECKRGAAERGSGLGEAEPVPEAHGFPEGG